MVNLLSVAVQQRCMQNMRSFVVNMEMWKTKGTTSFFLETPWYFLMWTNLICYAHLKVFEIWYFLHSIYFYLSTKYLWLEAIWNRIKFWLLSAAKLIGRIFLRQLAFSEFCLGQRKDSKHSLRLQAGYCWVSFVMGGERVVWLD